MIINAQMRNILAELQLVEGRPIALISRLPANEIGNRLIDFYYQTDALRTREMVREFLELAGVVWLRKLLMNDSSPVLSSQSQFATMSDYLGLLAANDDVSGLIVSA